MSVAFVFPGQGSQSVAMLADLAAEYSIIEQTFAEASEALGYDLWQLVQQGPAEQLNQTQITQPAILTASVALYRLWQSKSSLMPSYVAGHSLGEYSALVVAGVLSLAQAVQLVEKRGVYMQEAVPAGTGAMAAIIGLEDDQVVAACGPLNPDAVVQAVNFNSPGQVVIAGHVAAVEAAMDRAKGAGAKRALPLPVSVPSHCHLMLPAAERLQQDLLQLNLQTASLPVVQNVDAMPQSSAKVISEHLVAQLHKPVLWTQSVKFLAEQGVTRLIECGPGKVLTGLNKRIDKSLACHPMADLASFHQTLEAV